MSWLTRPHLLFALSALMILCIPWYASGKSAISLLILEVLGGIQLLILCCGHTRSSRYGLGVLVWLFLLFLVLGTAAYLLPLSFEQWSSLSGRERFAPAIEWLQANGESPALSASLVRERTVSSLILLLVLISLFVSVALQTDRLKKYLLILLLIVAAVQGILGVIQFSTRLDQWAFFDNPAGTAAGTYLNRDHFSALMYMMLPISLGLLANYFSQLNSRATDNQYSLVNVLGLALLVILFVCAALFSTSRAGIALTVLAMLLSLLAFALPVGGWKSAGIMGIVLVTSVGAAMSVGIVSALNRFIAINPFEDARWEFFTHAITGIKTFWPIGSGVGTFQEVYATLQPVEQARFINHVHNDYLELLFETGIIGAIILIFALLIYLKSWFSLRKIKWTEMKFIRVAAGISLLLLLLHELVDFNLHTPFNQVVFIVFCAIFVAKAQKADE